MDWLPRLNARGTLAAGLWLEGVTDATEMVQADSSTPPSPPVNGKPPYRYSKEPLTAHQHNYQLFPTLLQVAGVKIFGGSG